MNILTSYVTQHYAEEGGWDKPQEYTNFMLRLMQRPLLQVDPELFSEVSFNYDFSKFQTNHLSFSLFRLSTGS